MQQYQITLTTNEIDALRDLLDTLGDNAPYDLQTLRDKAHNDFIALDPE